MFLRVLATVWEFFNENIITPIKTWWDATASTGANDVFGPSNTIPVRVFRGLLDIGTGFTTEITKIVTGGLVWAFDAVD